MLAHYKMHTVEASIVTIIFSVQKQSIPYVWKSKRIFPSNSLCLVWLFMTWSPLFHPASKLIFLRLSSYMAFHYSLDLRTHFLLWVEIWSATSVKFNHWIILSLEACAFLGTWPSLTSISLRFEVPGVTQSTIIVLFILIWKRIHSLRGRSLWAFSLTFVNKILWYGFWQAGAGCAQTTQVQPSLNPAWTCLTWKYNTTTITTTTHWLTCISQGLKVGHAKPRLRFSSGMFNIQWIKVNIFSHAPLWFSRLGCALCFTFC